MEMSVFAAGLRDLRPRVVQFRGYYILDPMDDPTAEFALDSWANTFPNDHREVEIAYNHRHVASLISWLEEEDTESLLVMGEVYQMLLESELRKSFPDQEFEIVVDGDSKEEIKDDANEYQITFCRAR